MTSIPRTHRFDKGMILRLVGRASGRKALHGASIDKTGASAIEAGQDKAHAGADLAAAGASFEVQSDKAPYALNDDIDRVRFKRRGVKKIVRILRRTRDLLAAFLAFAWDLRSSAYTSDEKRIMLTRLRRWQEDDLDNYRRKKIERATFQLHAKQARLVRVQLVQTLTRLGFCYSVTKNERKYIKRQIRVAQVDVSPYAYIFHLDMEKIPFGVKTTDMAADWVSTELAASIGKKVRHELDLYGLRYTVEVGSSLSIPNFVSYNDIESEKKYAMSRKHPPLVLWLGLSTNGAPVYRNLVDAPHLIIAGSTGGGKSNIENAIACTLIKRNKPEILRLVFFDLKGGVEFSHFSGIPHLWKAEPTGRRRGCDGIVETPDDVMDALYAIQAECKTRLDRLKAAKVKNVQEFNRAKHAVNRMPYIVVFFDEWAITRTMVEGPSEKVLAAIANVSRAAGIHFILSTQYPKAEILNTTISVNFPWRIAFSMQPGASQSVLGSWDAHGLSPVGRAVIKTGGEMIQVQTPRITNSAIARIVTDAREGGGADLAGSAGVDEMDVLNWSIDNHGGKLDRDSLFNQFRERITVSALMDLLRSMEGKTYEVQGSIYIVRPAMGTLSRRMELAEDQTRPAADVDDKQQTTDEEEPE